MALEQITVKSTLADDRLALHEFHPEHPDGEAYVYGDEEKTVARTQRVQRALAEETLMRVTKSGKTVKAGDDEIANPPPPPEETANADGTAKTTAKK